MWGTASEIRLSGIRGNNTLHYQRQTEAIGDKTITGTLDSPITSKNKQDSTAAQQTFVMQHLLLSNRNKIINIVAITSQRNNKYQASNQ